MSPLVFRRSLRVLVAAGLVSCLGVATAALAATSSPTAASVLKAASKDLAKQTGVHIVANTTTGTTKSKVVVDLGPTSGHEEIFQGSKHVTITVTAKDAYVEGTKEGLIKIMGLTAAQVKIVGSKSIKMSSGSSPYASFKASLTTAALSQFLPTAKGTKLLPVVKGSGRYRLKWTIKGTTSATNVTSVLDVSSTSPSLPIVEVITGKSGGGTTTFSKWGESVTASSPSSSDTVAYKKVFG